MLTVRPDRDLNNEMFSHMSLEEFKKRSVLRSPSAIATEYENAVEEKKRELQQQEAERQKQQELQLKKERGIQVKDIVQGIIKGEDEDGNIIFDLKPPFDDGTYTGRILAQYRKGFTVKTNDGIWAVVLELEEYEDDKGHVTTFLWCRRATKEERQK
jgi:hypothetical protein